MKALEERERGSEVKAKQDHDTLKEEIKNKNLEENQMLRVTLDNVIDELEKHFEGAHQNYLQSTDQRTQDYRYLTRSDQARLVRVQAQRLRLPLTHCARHRSHRRRSRPTFAASSVCNLHGHSGKPRSARTNENARNGELAVPARQAARLTGSPSTCRHRAAATKRWHQSGTPSWLTLAN